MMRVKKLIFPVLVGVAGLVILVASHGCGTRSGDTNVIFISIDTLRADHLGCYGYARDTSPAIDRFAKRAILCRNAFSHTPKTAPSHMSMFTSLHPTVHGVHMFKKELDPILYVLDEKIKPLAEVLRENGYTCVAFTGGGNVGAGYGFDRGFEIYQTGKGHWQEGIDWIAANRGKKFFIFFHTYVVHDPYYPPEPFYSMFDPDYSGGMLRPPGTERVWVTAQTYWDHVNIEDEKDVKQLVALYDGEIRFMDERLMQPLLRALEELNLLKNSIVIFTSDHGEEFNEHGRFKHEQVYDELLHVPLLFRLPDRLAATIQPKEISNQIRLIDIMPTILELLDVRTPTHTLQGTSLVPVFRGEEAGDRELYATRVISSNRGKPFVRNYVLRLDGHKLIRNVNYKYRLNVPWEFYDLAADPGETRNLVSTDPDIIQRFRKRLFRLVSDNKKTREAGGYRYRSARFKSNSLEKLRALGYIQ